MLLLSSTPSDWHAVHNSLFPPDDVTRCATNHYFSYPDFSMWFEWKWSSKWKSLNWSIQLSPSQHSHNSINIILFEIKPILFDPCYLLSVHFRLIVGFFVVGWIYLLFMTVYKHNLSTVYYDHLLRIWLMHFHEAPLCLVSSICYYIFLFSPFQRWTFMIRFRNGMECWY